MEKNLKLAPSKSWESFAFVLTVREKATVEEILATR